MDNFNVPRKVNRHVLKALNVLSAESNVASVKSEDIVRQVRFQMRNLVPVDDLECTIYRSLNNLTSLGLLKCTRLSEYALNCVYGDSENAQAPGTNPMRDYFPPREVSNEQVFGLSSNRKRKHSSEYSLSGDEVERGPKSLRSDNKRFKRKGRKVPLPKARQEKRAREDTSSSSGSDLTCYTGSCPQLSGVNDQRAERLSSDGSTTSPALSAVVVPSDRSLLRTLQILPIQMPEPCILSKRDEEPSTVIAVTPQPDHPESEPKQAQSASGDAYADKNDDKQHVKSLIEEQSEPLSLLEELTAVQRLDAELGLAENLDYTDADEDNLTYNY